MEIKTQYPTEMHEFIAVMLLRAQKKFQRAEKALAKAEQELEDYIDTYYA